MATYSISVLREPDLVAGGGTAAASQTFSTVGSTFTYDAVVMPWYTLVVEDTGADTTTLSGDPFDSTNSDGGPNEENEGTDGETGTLFDPGGSAVGTVGARIAADRWGEMSGDDGSTILIYEIETYDNLDLYAFETPLVDGVTYTVTQAFVRDTAYSYAQMTCLVAGTLIDTPGGPRPVETLGPGCLVDTFDAGPCEVLWVTRRAVRPDQLERRVEWRPIRIRAGSLGDHGDLLVSPQHRIWLPDRNVPAGGLAPARILALARDGRFRRADGVRQVTYCNIVLARHHLIRAHGAWVESFYPGPRAVQGLNLRDRRALFAALPMLAFATGLDGVRAIYGPLARREMTRRDVAEAVLPSNTA